MSRQFLLKAAAEAEEVRSWTCRTCTTMTDDESPYCRSCAAYWDDVANGLWETSDYD